MFGPKVHQDEVPIPEDRPEADLEDMVGTRVNGRKNPRPVVRIYESDKQSSNLKAAPTSKDGAQVPSARHVRETTPDKNKDYEAWLEHKKKKWKETRDQRRLSRWVILLFASHTCTFHMLDSGSMGIFLLLFRLVTD